MTAEDVFNTISQSQYKYFGLRCDITEMNIGDYCILSDDWERDIDVAPKLNGTSSTKIDISSMGKIDAIAKIKELMIFNKNEYSFDEERDQYLVAGMNCYAGVDDNEIVINNNPYRTCPNSKKLGAIILLK